MVQIYQISFGTPEYDEAVALRHEVLRRPLGLEYLPEQLAREYDEIHLVAADATGRLVAYLNLSPQTDEEVKMRQVAVDPSCQGKGIGKALVAASERLARDLGFRHMTLHAREHAVDFYLQQGYQTVGDRFEEVTIPHFKMEKILE
ncbi:MAG: GNAT family N-acetyltransferase [Saprospiraceae bacterium]|nr:GNAT family N-acetyltransferase [Saprospiraceae bacterium]